MPHKKNSQVNGARDKLQAQCYRLCFVVFYCCFCCSAWTCLYRSKIFGDVSGPKMTDPDLASFCGEESPEFVTSSRESLVVFRSTSMTLGNGSFRLRYKAIREPSNSSDNSYLLRIAFGCFIGTVAVLVVCSGVFRKYKQSRPRPFFLFGRHRVNATTGARGRGRATASTAQAGNKSFKKRVTDFFQGVLLKLSPQRGHGESSTSETSENRSTSIGNPLASSITDTRDRSSSNNDEIADSEGDTIAAASSATYSSIGGDLQGHENFGYQSIPVSSFTSDPEAVKPPTYEDCLNSVNPLYLHHRGAYYNRALDLKNDDEALPHNLSPPPPYSETSSIDLGSTNNPNPQPHAHTTYHARTQQPISVSPLAQLQGPTSLRSTNDVIEEVHNQTLQTTTSSCNSLSQPSPLTSMTPVCITTRQRDHAAVCQVLSAPSTAACVLDPGIVTQQGPRSPESLLEDGTPRRLNAGSVEQDMSGVSRLCLDEPSLSPPSYQSATAGSNCSARNLESATPGISQPPGDSYHATQAIPPLELMLRAGLVSSSNVRSSENLEQDLNTPDQNRRENDLLYVEERKTEPPPPEVSGLLKVEESVTYTDDVNPPLSHDAVGEAEATSDDIYNPTNPHTVTSSDTDGDLHNSVTIIDPGEEDKNVTEEKDFAISDC